MKGSCLECAAEFRGRIDKKFCSDPCRNAWNNRKNREGNLRIRRIGRILRSNYRILEQCSRTAPGVQLTREALLEAGFNFRYITARTVFEGQTLYWVYDRAYVSLPGQGLRPVTGEKLRKAYRGLFPVLGAELKGGDNDILPADLTHQEAVLQNG